METFNYEIKNEEERKILVIALVVGIILSFIPFLIVMFAYGNKLNDSLMNIVKAFCNFDLLLFIIIFALGVIPILGLLTFLVSPLAFIVNLILILKALSAINSNQPVEIPVILKIF